MPKRIKSKILVTTLFCAVLLALAPADGLSQGLSETKLREQVKKYYSYFALHKYDRMWDMSSKRLQRENDNNKREYIQDLRSVDVAGVRVDIQKVEINGDNAKVRLRLHLRSAQDRQWISEDQENTWVLEQGRWVFDDHRISKATKNNRVRSNTVTTSQTAASGGVTLEFIDI